MKNIVKIVLPLLTIMFLFYYCTKPEKVYTNEVNYVHAELTRSGQVIAPNQVANAMSQPSTSPCLWDFDANGLVGSSDLSTFLQSWVILYDVDDLADFLANYGVEYTVNIIPGWNNSIQDVTNNLGWDVVLRSDCNNVITAFNTNDSLELYFEGDLIQTNGSRLNFQTYLLDGTINNIGWQPPCNGTNIVTMKVYYKNNI